MHAICCIQLISDWGTSWNQRIGGWRTFATIIRWEARACRSMVDMESHLVSRWLFPANASQSPGAERCSVALPRNDCWSLGRSAERVVWQRAGWISSMSASKPWAFCQFHVFYHLDEAGSCLPYLQRSETTTQLVKMQVTWWQWEYRLLDFGRLWLDNLAYGDWYRWGWGENSSIRCFVFNWTNRHSVPATRKAFEQDAADATCKHFFGEN